ncbi:hypothetical protein JKF63_04804 [Porcisia hertigi]|uniref:Uncharacterized protein n=1 Tax=Porcisia hertigi TaxID=2761500 RepID=A0A836IUV8_9TRYP|nr:hypothetical protein JKF63_04804 [Porcisia hertigi]
MRREENERMFGTALANEFQWRNLYLKEFGCCTYPPPMPKDPCTTAEGVFPQRRQVILLQQESSSSNSSNNNSEGADSQDDSNDYDDTSTEGSDMVDFAPGQPGAIFYEFPLNDVDNDKSNPRRHQSQNGHLSDAEALCRPSSRGARTTADQFFSLDMSFSVEKNETEVQPFQHSRHRSGQRRAGHGTMLRKDDFFDANDIFSAKFFSFLWTAKDSDDYNNEQNTVDSHMVEHQSQSSVVQDSVNLPAPRRALYGGRRSDANHLTLSRAGFSTLLSSAFRVNPHDLPQAVLQLHHQSWALLMDNRLMAWVHREAAEHCQRATVLRQRLLDIIANGPTTVDGIAFTFSDDTSTSLLLPQEDTLQRTLESFSPFFVVVAPPAAVQRSRDHIQAARHAQTRSTNRQQVSANPAADLTGLPLLSQYGSWKEAYEHRRRWDKSPFSFFLIHDVSYNYAQITAFFVELQLLYTHTHHHARHCLEARRAPVPLQNVGRQVANLGIASRATAEQSDLCPLLFMEEMTEDIILAYEQSPAHTTLPMLRRVLDFLTDAALDAPTAYRFISREALRRQHQFEVPGVTMTRPLPTSTADPALPVDDSTPGTSAEAASDTAQDTESDAATASDEPESCSIGISGVTDGVPAKDKPSGTRDDDIPVNKPHIEPKRVTEDAINSLFEIAYWFVDATTANAKVPLDSTSLAGVTAGARGAPSSMYQAPNSDESQSTLSRYSSRPPPAEANGPSASPIPQSQQYLPGRVQLHHPVGSLAEAVARLESYRNPFKPRDDRPVCVGRKRRQGDARARRGSGALKKFTSSNLPAAPLSSTFTGFISPLVILTTYLRLHGGTWLKQLCRHVFELLRKPGVLLYVNTLELDATWASLLSPPPQPTLDAPKQADAVGMRGRQYRPPSVISVPPTSSAVVDAETMRSDFFYGLACLEDLICQDILYALNYFLGSLYGKRALSARLPQGISLLLTQFVSTMHLYMLESVGVTRAAVFADNTRSGSTRPGGRAHSVLRGVNAADETPTRIVKECLGVCKQRYHASLRRCGGASEPGKSHVSAFRGADGSMKSLGSSATAEDSAPTAAASLPRLLQTIEQHRLSKFILFDCWILPALNNAVSLGYLAPDSPMHLRWNVDALARYLKILVHAPFVEEDKKSFGSLSSHPLKSTGKGSRNDQRSKDSGDSKEDRSADKRPTRSKVGNRGSQGSARRPTILTLPPFVTGIYDVVTGSLVRMQTSVPVAAGAAARFERPNAMHTLAQNPATTEAPPTTLNSSPSTLTSPVMSTVVNGESVDGETLSMAYDVENSTSFSIKSRTPSGQSKGTLEATALPPSLPATYEAQSQTTQLQSSGLCEVSQHQISLTARAKTTVAPRSAASSRLLSVEGDMAKEMLSSDLHRATDRNSHSPKDSQDGHGVSLPKPPRNISDKIVSAITQPSLASQLGSTPSTDYSQNFPSSSDASNGVTVTLTHPYVVMDDAEWVDMSPVLQSLNDSIGLSNCNRSIDGTLDDEANKSWSTPRLPKVGGRGGITWSSSAATRALGAAGQLQQANGIDLPTFDSDDSDLPALRMLNAFAYTACTDDSDHLLVCEYEVLPSIAAGCIDKLYEFATDRHPMVAHALQKGVFDFAYDECNSMPRGLTSLYTACMNGVLLHPRTASHVLKNVMENNERFSRTLLKPVTDTTVLDLLGSLATHSGDTPMVDVNAVVPLIHSLAPSRAAARGTGRRPQTNVDTSNGGTILPPIGAKPAAGVSTSAIVARRWERESRRLLREFVFLTTGNDNSGPLQPLVPGLRRPIGPPHPAQIIRAGAARIMEDTGNRTPMVFDPWWRAMVVALCVKAFNVFAECSSDQAASFEEIRHRQMEDSKRLHRYTSAHFVSTEGRETCRRDSSAGGASHHRPSFLRPGSSSAMNSMLGPPQNPKRKLKRKKTKSGAGRKSKSPGMRAKKWQKASAATAL